MWVNSVLVALEVISCTCFSVQCVLAGQLPDLPSFKVHQDVVYKHTHAPGGLCVCVSTDSTLHSCYWS